MENAGGVLTETAAQAIVREILKMVELLLAFGLACGSVLHPSLR